MIKVGTCGYGYYQPGEGWKDRYESKLQAYSDQFSVGEINKTFYKLPMVKTAEKWRKNAFDDFEFTVKAWQALTHPTSSPTWRDKKSRLSEKQKKNFGYLRPNDDVLEAWEETKKRAEALGADVCLIQTPGSFGCSEENIEKMRELFDRMDMGDLDIAWEPRGDWKENRDRIEDICNELDLIHVVDIMRRKPVSEHEYAYIRLHGLNENEYNYNYDYSDDELQELAGELKELDQEHKRVYCMFNNYEMFHNAEELKKILGK